MTYAEGLIAQAIYAVESMQTKDSGELTLALHYLNQARAHLKHFERMEEKK